MKKKFIVLFFLIIGCGRYQIQETESWTPIIEKIQSVQPETTLLLLDVDRVLTVPSPENILNGNIRKDIWKNAIKNLSVQEKLELKSVFLNKHNPQLPDSKVIDLINYVKQKRINTAALTKAGNLKTKFTSERYILRYNDLKKLGIDFKILFSDQRFIQWYDLNAYKDTIAKEIIGPATLKYGIIFAAGNDKGTVLERVLKETNISPKTIVFVDDQKYNIESVKRTCKKYGIQYFGYIYTGSKLVKPFLLDEDLETKRMEVFVKEKKWLNIDETKQRFKKQSKISSR